MRTVCVAVLLACMSGFAGANETAYFSDLPVVLSASRLSQPQRDAPGSMTVITKEMIRLSGARDLADVMRWVPGFQVAQSTDGYNAPVAVYHGLWTGSPNGMQILVDGRTQYSPLWFGGINFNALQVALEDIERIEVLRGSNSASYGSNATQGVINIITTEPALARGKTVAVNFGNQGVRDVYARIAGGSEEFSQRLSVSRQGDFGLKGFPDSRETVRLDWRGDLRLSPADEVRVMVGGLKSRYGLGKMDNVWLTTARDRKNSVAHVQADWTRRLAGDDALHLRYFHARESMREHYIADTLLPHLYLPPPATTKLAVNAAADVARDDFELQHSLSFDQALRVVWGFGLRSDRFKSQYYYGDSDAIRVITKRLFAHVESRLATSWLLNAGGTLENESIAGSAFSPRVTLTFQPTQNHSLRFGLSRSHRTPSLSEQRANLSWSDPSLPAAFSPLMYVYKSDGHLKPERLDSVELGYLGEWRDLGLTLDVRAFDDRLKDRIVSYSRILPAAACVTCGPPLYNPALTFINGQDVTTRGLEYQVRWRTPWGARVWFNQTFLRIRSTSLSGVSAAAAPAVIGQTERSAPRHAESIHWMQELPAGMNLTVSYSRAAVTQWSFVADTATSYERIDWRLAWPFKTADGNGEIAWTARAGNGPVREFSGGVADWQRQNVHPRHWLSLRLDF